jgi:hypothetical protein
MHKVRSFRARKKGRLSLKRAESALEPLIRELGLESALRLHIIGSRWGSLFPGSVSLHSAPSMLKDGELLVNVDSPAWLHEISYHRAGIIVKLRSLGVKDIRLRLGRVGKAPRAVPSSPEKRLPEKDSPFVDEVVSGIKDPELRASIRGALEKWASRAGHSDGSGATAPDGGPAPGL